MLIFIIIFGFLFYYLQNSIGIKTFLSLSRMFIFTPSQFVEEYDGRTNILVLGRSEELTDTIILISIPHSKNKPVSIISVPRDIWIDEYKIKINSAYYYNKNLPQKIVENMFNTKIQYTISLGFEDFVKIIDLMNGIDVNVEHAFVDEKYPIKGKENDLCDGDVKLSCRYETIRFEKGNVLMSGDLALKYVRSRKSSDLEEGTDIARSRRQREVMNAVFDKVFSFEIILQPKKVGEIYSTIWSLFDTDLSPRASALLARRIFDNRKYIESFEIPQEFLEVSINDKKYNNLYVFYFKGETYNDFRKWFYKNVLQKEF